MDYSRIDKQVDTDKAWVKVYERLRSDGLLTREEETRRVFAVPGWVSYAAVFMAIMMVGSMSYFLINNLRSTRLLTLETGADNCTFVQTLGDGSVVYIANNSVLNYPVIFSEGQRKVYLSGEAFFDVFAKSDQPFVIETSQALFEVLGTAFNLRSYDDDFELIVEEGFVRVTLRDMPGQSEIVGEWEMLTGLSYSMKKSSVIDRTYLSWRTNRMQFKDETLENVASVISKNLNVNIGFENDALKERRMTATFYNNAINTITEVISLSMDIDYEILPDSSILFREKM